MICVGQITFTSLAIIGDSPSLCISTMAPGANALPCKVTVIALAAIVPELGVMLKISGGGSASAVGVTVTVPVGAGCIDVFVGVVRTEVGATVEEQAGVIVRDASN